MSESNLKINCETEGFEEAEAKLEAFVDAYDGFPAQVTLKNCRDCHIEIYPSQTKIVEAKDE